MNFDKWGHKVTLNDLLPDLSAEDVNRAIEEQIPEERLFYNHSVNRVPKTFYVGKNGKIYVVFQQYEIGALRRRIYGGGSGGSLRHLSDIAV